ncbi:MAG: hypothetical protein RIM72_11980 [Alphaproteobacteria bacterium]
MTDVPFSLYLDIEENENADLEVVARAAIAWSRAVKDAAYIMDPSSQVSIKLVSGTDGSLFLNSIIRFYEKQKDNPRRRIIALGALLGVGFWLANTTLTFTLETLLDRLKVPEAILEAAEYFGVDLGDDVSNLSEQDLESIAKRIADIIKRERQNDDFKTFFSELQKDKSIRGVGITKNKDTKPAQVISRAQFAELAGGTKEDEDDDGKRTRYREIDLWIVGLRLKDDDRVWRFSGPDGEFSAQMGDKKFLHDFLSGNLEIDVSNGVMIRAIVKYNEHRENGVWAIKSTIVTEVIRYQGQLYQASLFARQNPTRD